MNLITLTYTELRACAVKTAHGITGYAWLKGMANRNTRLVALMAPLERLEGRYVSHIPDTLLMLTSHYDT